VVRQWLDRELAAGRVHELHRRPLLPGDALERTDGPTGLRAPRQLRGTENRRVLGHVRILDRDREVAAERRDLGRSPNAPRGEHRQARDVGAEEATEPTEPEVSRARDKE